MTAILSPYCATVRSFFKEIAWSEKTSSGLASTVSQFHGSANSGDWRCASIHGFFGEMDWTRRRETFAFTHTPIKVVHPMAMPVGHFFRDFGQLASPKAFR